MKDKTHNMDSVIKNHKIKDHVMSLEPWLWNRSSEEQIPWFSTGPTAWTHTFIFKVLQMSETPTFFFTSTLSAVPSLVGHNHQWWRILFRDLGSVCGWQYFKHHLLKAKSHCFLFFPISHHLGLIYILVSMIMPCTAIMSSCLCFLPHFIIMLIPMCHSCLWS